MPGQLLSQRDIAKHIGKAFSTVSGYVDQFPEFFSHNGEEGLTRRYYPESLVVAEMISELKSQRLPMEEIRELLIQRFQSNVPNPPVERPETPIEPYVERSMHKKDACQAGEATSLPPEASPLADVPLVEAEQAEETAPPDASLIEFRPTKQSDNAPIERLIERSMNSELLRSAEEAAATESAFPVDSYLASECAGDGPAEDLREETAPFTPTEDAHLTELASLIAKQQGQIAALEERVQSILDIQAALVHERDQYHADLAADLLERDKLMVKWVKDLHSQPSKPGGWLRRVWLLSPFGRPRA